MLFVLTGNVQTGKTRWLEAMLDELREGGVEVHGVLAPGVWRALPDGAGYEKLGIENLLLPQGERVLFARRQDLAEAEGAYDASSQSAQAHLRWEMPEGALELVNEHLRRLPALPPLAVDDARDGAACDFAKGPGAERVGRLLLIDEVGRLELLRNGGLTAALDILDAGPMPTFAHTLIVVREELLELARERFEPVWGPLRVINADDAGRAALKEAFG